MDAVSEQRLGLVCPVLAVKVRAMAADLEQQGIIIRVVQGLRTIQEQDTLYAQGRTQPGKIVTNVAGGKSWHNFGMAVDCVPGVRGETIWRPNWSANDPDFRAMIAAALKQGLVAGALWKSFPDEDHFQLPGIAVSPDVQSQAALKTGSLQEFWASYSPV